jgi:hypothetical protein
MNARFIFILGIFHTLLCQPCFQPNRPNIRHFASLDTSARQVVAALCQRAKGNPNVFVPFRDSKLTQLLYSSLKGTGRALMLGCCAPVKVWLS